MDLGKSGKDIKPYNDREWTHLYLHCMKNIEWADGAVKYRILEIGMFSSYDNTYDSRSDSDSLSSCSLTRNPKHSMSSRAPKYLGVNDFKNHYTCTKRVTHFWRHISHSSMGDEGDIILDTCFKREWANMITPHDSLNPLFYLHPSIVYDLGF